jgi:hypothetical protein
MLSIVSIIKKKVITGQHTRREPLLASLSFGCPGSVGGADIGREIHIAAAAGS